MLQELMLQKIILQEVKLGKIILEITILKEVEKDVPGRSGPKERNF